MKDLGKDPNTAWNKLWNSLIHPMTLIPIIGAILALLSGYFLVNEDNFFRSVLQLLSALLIGISINHFTSLYGKQEEKRILKFKAEHTVRLINDRINSILRKGNLSDNDKDTIDSLINLMDYWKDYYKKVDSARIAYHKKSKNEMETEKDPEKKKDKQAELENIEYKMLEDGLTSYAAISGSSAYDYFKYKNR